MFGEITNAKLLASWEFIMQPADKLPQDLASAVAKLFTEKSKVGGSYEAEYYVAKQLVNGYNHKLIFKRTMLVSGGKEVVDFAVITINIPSGDIKGEKATVVSEEDVNNFVLRDDIETGYKQAVAEWTGTRLIPLIEIGEQVVKGINYIFICETKPIYKNTKDNAPYLTQVSVNNFEGEWKIVEVKRL